MAKNIASETLLLLGGAAAGAVAMYLLDPEKGNDRRSQLSWSQLSGKAQDVAASASESLHDRYDETSSSAKNLAANVAHYAQQLVNQVKDHASTATDQVKDNVEQTHGQLRDSIKNLVGRVKDYASQLRDHAASSSDDIADRATEAYSRARSSAMRRAGVQESHPVATATGVLSGSIGVLALGAGAMYFFDPSKGRARRAWAKDKIFSWSSKSQHAIQQQAHHLRNKVKGMAADAQGSIPQEWSDAVDRATTAAVETVKHHTGSAETNSH